MIVPPPGSPVAFERVRVFDGAVMHEDATVIVHGATIAAVGPAGTAPEPGAHVAVVAGDGRTLLPGFIDAHVHIGFFRPADVLRAGVTTVRDLGWQPAPIAGLANQLASIPNEGPRVLFAGPMITAPDGYPSTAAWAPRGTAFEVESPDEARAAVREILALGASFVKIAQEPHAGPTLPEAVVRAIVDEAHAAGIRVTSHCGSIDQLEIALACGVDELAHGLWSDDVIPDDLVVAIAEAGVTVVPTLHVEPSEQRLASVRALHEARVRILYGTDMGNPPVPGGIDVDELALMCAAGLTTRQALAAATGDAADYLGLDDRGWIEAGAAADLVLVDGDPAQDLGVLSRPVLVMRDGVAVG